MAKFLSVPPREIEDMPVLDFFDAQEYMIAQLYIDGAYDEPEDY